MHTLRCAPCSGHLLFYEFDNLLCEGISVITNSLLSDLQWLQASLPIREGGLGIRHASLLALSTFLASAASTTFLQDLLLQSATSSRDHRVMLGHASWSQLYSANCPTEDSAFKQRTWDAPAVTRDWHCIWDHAKCDLDKARLVTIKSPHSSDWLFALPVSTCGLRLSDEAIRIAVSLRLGLNLCEPHICPRDANVDARGLHSLSCKCGTGRSSRYQQLNDIIWQALKRADIPATEEPAGLVQGYEKRSDGLTLVPWQDGRCLTWDATIVDTLAVSYVPIGSTASNGAADAAAARKHAKYDTHFGHTYLRTCSG